MQCARRYERAKEEVGKWQPLVKAHREAPTLSFLAGRGDAGRPSTTAALVAAQVRAQPGPAPGTTAPYPGAWVARHTLQGKKLPAPSATAALVAAQVLAQPGSSEVCLSTARITVQGCRVPSQKHGGFGMAGHCVL